MAHSRRSFIKKAAAGIGLFTILPREVLGKMGGDNSYVAPSDQLTRGIIGTGGIGMSGLHFASDRRCRLVAVCDVDKYHLRRALDAGVEKFGTRLQAYSEACKKKEPINSLANDPKVKVRFPGGDRLIGKTLRLLDRIL